MLCQTRLSIGISIIKSKVKFHFSKFLSALMSKNECIVDEMYTNDRLFLTTSIAILATIKWMEIQITLGNFIKIKKCKYPISLHVSKSVVSPM